MKKLYIAVIALLSLGNLYAQDPIFTQYFLVPETLNPSFTGYLKTANFGVIHRSQWPDLNLRVDTDFAYGSQWLEQMNSGIGVTVLNHRENFTGYTFAELNVAYAYDVMLSNDWHFLPSIEVGGGMKSFGFNDLVLEDQINIGTGTISSGSIDPGAVNAREKFAFADFSAGMLFYNEKAWLGLSLKHLNRPNISLTQHGNLPLNMFFSASAAYKFKVADYIDIINLPLGTEMLVNANFMKQGEYTRLDLGTELLVSEFFVGVSAATSPFNDAQDGHFLTSVNAFAGLQYQHFKFGFSHDFNVTGIGKTGGIYEISLGYQFDLYSTCFSCPQRGTDMERRW